MSTSDDAEQIALGERLRDARTYRGYSQEEVAKYLGVSRTSVSLIESGSRGVDSLELRRFAELFECPIEELLGQRKQATSDQQKIAMVARAAATLSPEDQNEVLRFAEFLQARRRRKGDGNT
jgi:transcriptional regulator with XRE-family HTH domain